MGKSTRINKIKGMALCGKEGLECEIRVDGARLEEALELKCLDESCIDVAEC